MDSKRKLLDKTIFGVVIFLTLFGYIMVVSAHASVWLKYGAIKFFFEIGKIFVFIIFGFFLMTTINNKYNQKWLNRNFNKIFLIIIAMMIATIFFAAESGAKAWIRIPLVNITLQPVEFLKIALIIYLSNYFAGAIKNKLSLKDMLLAPIIVVFSAVGFVFIIQNDLGSALILLMIALCIFLCIPSKQLRLIKIVTILFFVIVIVLFYLNGHMLSNWIYSLPNNTLFKPQLIRIAVLFDPLHNVYTSGYQLTNSLVSLSDCGLFGHGIGNSTTKFIVPEPYNDAILSVIAEETGLIGILLVFGSYIIIEIKLLNYALLKRVSLRDRFILIGITSFFMAQFFVNVGGMVGAIPMTGVTLLFISSGGSSIITVFILVGLAQAIIRKYLK